LDISRTLRTQNKSYHNTNNSLDTHCRKLTSTISVLDRDLKQAQGHGDEAERQKIEIQQRLHTRNEELAESVATAEALKLEIEALQVQVKDVELLKFQVQDLESSARDVQQAKQDAEAHFEEQRSKWEEEVAELKASEKNALEATHLLQLKYDTLAQEKQQLQEGFELSGRNQKEALAKASEEHKNSVCQLKMDQLRQVREVRSDCNAAHQEQVNLSTLKYAEIMKEKDSAKAKEVAKRDELQRAYDKLEQDNASTLENLRTVQSELEASTSEASELKAQIDTREGDLHQLRQELNEAKSEVAGQKKSLEAVQEDLSTLRESAAREKNEIEETRAT
jgi:chromosome segregation ATPase